ncbi:DoxX family protein [Aureimonas sp. Leaf454]|uniref:DoxX family protein n=1 Tax=Aureimonas sp. Leaf454 TaxID=1736381 RepID=UPI0007020927|nr:DoxX family protein [Aureimonas sp. Leaf454]KQT45068.1 DoxX family protein [Aureimonas sp. Leaf454]
MPTALARLLRSSLFCLLARILLTFVFWGAGLAKAIDFEGATAEVAGFGLQPAAAINGLAVVVLLAGSALVILDRMAWLGLGALAVFTALTIPLVHHFWTMEGAEATAHFHTATEHVTVIGALMIAAILSHRLEEDGVADEGSPPAAVRAAAS